MDGPGRHAGASVPACIGINARGAREVPITAGSLRHPRRVRRDAPGHSHAEAGERRSAARRSRFESLALPLASPLRAAARRAIGRADLADDFVQETFLRAYRSFDSFEPGTNVRAWLFTILYSVCANHRRSERLRRTASIEEIESLPLALADPDALRDLVEGGGLAWRGTDAERALAALPDPFRSAVELVDLAELSYEEAAQVLDCPVGTLRSRLFRGRRALARLLVESARSLGLSAARGDGDA